MKNTRLVTQRKRAGFTQFDVSSQLGIHVRDYQGYEAGNHEPRIGTAIRIAEMFGCDVGDIFGE